LLFDPKLVPCKAPTNVANPSVPEFPDVAEVFGVVLEVVELIFFELAPFKAPSSATRPSALPVPLGAFPVFVPIGWLLLFVSDSATVVQASPVAPVVLFPFGAATLIPLSPPML